jgi:hypothetical protein
MELPQRCQFVSRKMGGLCRIAEKSQPPHSVFTTPTAPKLQVGFGGVWGGFGGVWGGFGGVRGGSGGGWVGAGGGGGGWGGRLRQHFFGFLRSEATRLLLKLRAG